MINENEINQLLSNEVSKAVKQKMLRVDIQQLIAEATQKELESDVLLVALRERLRLVVREDQIDIIMRLLRAEAMLNDTQGLDDG